MEPWQERPHVMVDLNEAPLYLGVETLNLSGETSPFIQNMKLQGLMVPPEHRAAVTPLLKQIAALTWAG